MFLRCIFFHLFHRSKHYFCFALGALVAIFGGCNSEDSLWDLPISYVEGRVASGDYGFLRNVDYSRYRIRDVSRLGSSASFYLAHIFERISMGSMSSDLLRVTFNNGEEPWRMEAGLLLLDRFERDRDWRSARRIATIGLRRYPDNLSYYRHVLNANYWLEEDARLLNLLPDYQELINYEDDNPIWEIRHRQSEVMLWRLVVAYRNGNDEWRRLADQFFSDYTASQFHHRFFLYLQSNPRLENALFERQRRFFEAKTNVATGEYDRAAEIFSALIPTLSVSEIRGYFSPRSIRDLGRAYLYSESAGGAGAELMGALLPMLETSNSGVAHEWLGRLYNAVDSHNLSARHFREALEITPDDRHLWLYFREILEIGPRDFAEALEARYNEIDNPAYFSDLLQRLVSELLWERDWETLLRTRDIVEAIGARRDRAQWNVILAEAARIGLFAATQERRESLRAGLIDGYIQNESYFYAALSGSLLGREASPALRSSPIDDPLVVASDCMIIVDGFIRYSLLQEANAWSRTCADRLDPETFVEIARLYGEAGEYSTSLRVMDTIYRAGALPVDTARQKLVYPLAFRDQVDDVVSRYHLPRAMFYSLLRVESYFSPEIISRAGAIGLAQMMPATAEDMIWRMGIDAPDLTDPEDNLEIGGFYFNDLLRAFREEPALALSAYNAGITRVRRWRREYPDFSSLLLIEAMPFRETRQYVRSIMVAAMRYTHIYEEDSDIRSVISLFFPTMRAL